MWIHHSHDKSSNLSEASPALICFRVAICCNQSIADEASTLYLGASGQGSAAGKISLMASSASGGGVDVSAPTSAPALSAPVSAAASLYQHHHHHLPPPTGSQTSQSPAPNPQASRSPNTEGPQHQPQMSHGQQPTRNVSPPTFLSPRAGAASVTESTPYQTLIHLFKTTDPCIVRQAIRDTHEVTLLGSEYHFAFLVRFRARSSIHRE